jgi:uncharacterized membrane protein
MLNDWEIEKCLRLTLAILVAAVGLVGLAAPGFDISIPGQIVGSVFLTLIPGILILRILKIHNTSLICSIGLSLAFVMSDVPALPEDRRLLYDNGAAQMRR